MILTCPECATRFSADTESIGPNGRTVRCSQCSTTWFASADPDILSLNEIQNPPVIDSTGEEADQISEPNHENNVETGTVKTGQSTSEPHAVMRDKAERKKVRSRLMSVLMIWLTTMLLLALAVILAWFFRAQIVEKFPSSRVLYDAVGVEASETGLMIHKIRAEYGDVDGMPVLFINGEIKNYDLQNRDVPLVQINFKNDAGEILQNWVIEPPKSSLESGESQTFTSQYPNPPIDATKLVPIFVDETAVSIVPSDSE